MQICALLFQVAKIDNQAEALGRLKLAILDVPVSTPYVTPTAARALHSPCCTVQWGTTKIVKFKETYIRYSRQTTARKKSQNLEYIYR